MQSWREDSPARVKVAMTSMLGLMAASWGAASAAADSSMTKSQASLMAAMAADESHVTPDLVRRYLGVAAGGMRSDAGPCLTVADESRAA